MAYSVPDGSKLFLSIAYGAAVAVSAVTNADPAVATTSATHGLDDRKEFIFTSGWEDANNRVFRADNAAGSALDIEGLDSTNLSRFTEGGGIGSIKPITGWQEIQQVLNPSSTGGDPKYATVEPLASLNDFQIPTGFTAQSITIPIGDDASLPGYKALKKASEERLLCALKVLKPNGNVNYFYGYAALNEMPSLTKGQVDTVTATFAPQGQTTRYAS